MMPYNCSEHIQLDLSTPGGIILKTACQAVLNFTNSSLETALLVSYSITHPPAEGRGCELRFQRLRSLCRTECHPPLWSVGK